MPRKVAVTALRAWLKCPFRFYLRYGLQMEAVDPTKSELDAMDFGTLCHAALEAMGREVGLRDCTDEGVLRGFLLDALDREAARRFGAELTLPLIVQLESARQRLSRAAAVQAATRAEGWVIEKVEEKFEIAVDELVVVGKIDRIERNEITGEYRVIDYKTSDRPVNPMEAHLRNLRRGESVPEFAFAGPGGEGPVWMDLQLPLYLRAVAVGGAPVSCAYFNLPKAAGETGIRPWTDYTRELESSAWRCAEGVAAAIVAGEFWPPNEDLRAEWDDYATLFHHGVADSIAWEEGAP
jgi:ATP-dependent helicase/nuclease subunit B